MRRKQHVADKKFFLIVATIVLLSVLLSSNYSYATTEGNSSVSNPVLKRANAEDLNITMEPIAVRQPRLPQTSSELDIEYLNMSLVSQTNMSAKDLDAVFEGTGMEGLGEAFKEAESLYDINAAALASIAIHESAWGASSYARNRNNLFGFAAYTNSPNSAKGFDTKESCVLYVADFLKTNYLEEDGKYYVDATLAGINPIYAADTSWKHNISTIWERLENGYFLH
ncbi:glucosaminidase domain-containing protein [Clostridia bacterium]|nr:glucosaminidase domain-containing protein [Clostridia bacterium]